MLQKPHYFTKLCCLDEGLAIETESEEEQFTDGPYSETNQISAESLNLSLAQPPHLQTTDTYKNISSVSKILLLPYYDLIHQPSHPQTRPANKHPRQLHLQLISSYRLLEFDPTAISPINPLEPKLLSEKKPSLTNSTGKQV